jgi:hypothetical protein
MRSFENFAKNALAASPSPSTELIFNENMV